nr:MAG: hypothetical protein EDM05_35325 [Leptolyngbya sp. IPPAS B-1204]
MQWLVQTLIGQLKPLLVRLTELTLKIDRCFTALPDADWFAALPGAGEHLAPRLLAAFGEDRSRFDNAQQMMCYFGIAPVKESSGKKNWVHWRWSCPIFLRQTFVEWANQSRHHCAWAQAYYRMQRAKGNSHPAAMRSLAFKWIRILFRCWKNREAYDEAKYVAALRRFAQRFCTIVRVVTWIVMKPYSLDLREKIISTYEAGNTSIRQVAARFQVSKNTVQSLLKRKQATGTLKPAPATGGKTSQLAGFEQEIAEMVEQHQDYTLAEYCESWQEKTGVRVSESTMCRFLQKQQLTVKKNISQRSSRSSG